MTDIRPTIWMNVTMSATWRRPAVGILRVEQEICLELQKIYPDNQFKLCIWNRDHFIEWCDKASQLKTKNLVGMSLQDSVEKDIPLLFPVLSKNQALVSIAQGILSLTPAKFQPIVNRLLIYLKAKLIKIRLVRSRINLSVTPRTLLYHLRYIFKRKALAEQSIFKKGDVLISIGMDWNYSYPKTFYYLRKIYGIKIVTCCYDLIPVVFPQYLHLDIVEKFTSYFLDVAEGSDVTLCISKQTEKDFNALLDQTGGRKVNTRVFTLGDNIPESHGEISSVVQDLIEQPFILFVSSIERRKNHEVLYKAYHLLCLQGKSEDLPKMVFVGMAGWGVDDLLKDIELDPLTQSLFVQLNHVNDAELQLLYVKALFCVYPSFYEGWGLPVSEALAMGKLVISSDQGSLPEVGGALVIYVDPWNPRDWAQVLWQFIAKPELREAYEKEVVANYQIRTWSDTALSVSKVVKSLLDD